MPTYSSNFDSASYLSRMTGAKWQATDSDAHTTVTNKQAKKIQKIIEREGLQVERNQTTSGTVITIESAAINRLKMKKDEEALTAPQKISSLVQAARGHSLDATTRNKAIADIKKIIDDPDETMQHFLTSTLH